jgi:5-methylcytosine-specific restriction endonuclease McrA
MVMKPKYSTVQAKADKAMSQYIRQKYAKDGMVTCVSCGKVMPWKEADCGHFVPKSRGASIRYVEENCHPECQVCNRFDDGHLAGYTLFMIDTYGREKIEELRTEARKTLSQTAKRKMAEEAFIYYTQALKDL